MATINNTIKSITEDILSTEDCPIWSEDDTLIAENIAYYIDGVFVSLIVIIGLIMNSVAIFIIYKEGNNKHIFNRMIGSLFCIDIFVLVTAIFTRMFVVFKIKSFGYLFPQFSYPLHYISMTASIYLTIAIAYERHVGIKSPVYFNYLLQTSTDTLEMKRFLYYVVPVIIGSILFNIPKFLEFSFYEGKLQPNYLVNQLWYRKYYQNWGGLIILGIVPYIILLYFNMKICMDLRNQEDATKLSARNSPKVSTDSQNRKISPGTKFVIERMDRKKSPSYNLNRPYGLDHISQGSMNKTLGNERMLAKICMGIVILFLVCHLIRVLNNLNIVMIWGSYVKCKEHGKLPGIHVWQYNLTIFGFVFVIIHSAINIPLYYMLNIKLRSNSINGLDVFGQKPIIRKPIRRFSEVKGEPDGASEPILTECRRLSDFSSTTVIAPTLRSTTTLSQSTPDVGKASDSIIQIIPSLSTSNDNMAIRIIKNVSEIPDLKEQIQKPFKGTLKRKMTIAKSSMTPLVARQNTLENEDCEN